MALVPGEDSESDEEINTEHLQSLVLTPDGSLAGPGYRGLMTTSQQKAAGIVMGEESETDEEEEEGPMDQPDGGGGGREVSRGSAERAGEESSETTPDAPQSLLHKKLRESNVSLRRNIVERIVKLYRITCRNLTLVNNNLSKAQGTIETVNSNLKRSEHDLSELNSMIADINKYANTIAPHLNTMFPQGGKKSPSPIRQRLLKGMPKAFLQGVTSKPPSLPEEGGAREPGGRGLTIPEAHPGSGSKLPEAPASSSEA